MSVTNTRACLGSMNEVLVNSPITVVNALKTKNFAISIQLQPPDALIGHFRHKLTYINIDTLFIFNLITITPLLK